MKDNKAERKRRGGEGGRRNNITDYKMKIIRIATRLLENNTDSKR